MLPRNSSYISLMQNSYRKDNLKNYNQISRNEEGKANNDYINIKKLVINSKNTLSKLTNKTNSIELKDKFALLRKRQNKMERLNNILKINNNARNVFNINNNENNNVNNNSNINIYLSINMFNKMINNHFNKNKITNERNTMQDLLNKQKQSIINDNKKRSLDNHHLNYGSKKKYFLKNNNKFKINKIICQENKI